ncbi:MAG: flagellar biosynthetic protein FliO [Candidatus Methylomirabilota bacterium]|nr:flagellar biosynthetic protein FliO [candidate division NC10 bacterium]PWB43975.1 MAG: flagellar biosynthetic protein FliO [candidate division NC10 bacterium]
MWVAVVLWLIAVPSSAGSAELPQGAQVSEPASIVDPQPLDLPSYRDPESPLPEAGVTSQVFTALGTVLGVLALGVYLYKRVVLRGPRGASRDGTVRILGRTYLGPKESLCLVQVGTDVLLLGHTGSGITLLHTLPSSVLTAPSDGGVDEASIGPMEGTEHRAPSGWARERKGALDGLEGRLRRLNRLWGSGGAN